MSPAIGRLHCLWHMLRHCLHPGDLIVMEEPTAGLYPTAATDLMQALVAASNQGVRVVMTTHDMAVQEIMECLVMLDMAVEAGATPPARMADWPGLSPARVGFHLLSPMGARPATVREVCCNLDRGGFFTKDSKPFGGLGQGHLQHLCGPGQQAGPRGRGCRGAGAWRVLKRILRRCC